MKSASFTLCAAHESGFRFLSHFVVQWGQLEEELEQEEQERESHLLVTEAGEEGEATLNAFRVAFTFWLNGQTLRVSRVPCALCRVKWQRVCCFLHAT